MIGNFVTLPKRYKEKLRGKEYIIYEHDHKYLKIRNPAVYENFKAPEQDIVVYFFYKNARRVFCQSKFHKEIVEKNLNLNNVVSLGGNLWSEQSLSKMREICKKPKKHHAQKATEGKREVVDGCQTNKNNSNIEREEIRSCWNGDIGNLDAPQKADQTKGNGRNTNIVDQFIR